MSNFKPFLEVFKRYQPSSEIRSLLSRVTDARYRYSSEPLRVEVELSFSSHEDSFLL